MRSARSIAGMVLIAMGVIGLIVKGIDYTRRETIIEVGPIRASAETRDTLRVPAWAAVGVVVVGVVLLVASKPRSNA